MRLPPAVAAALEDVVDLDTPVADELEEEVARPVPVKPYKPSLRQLTVVQKTIAAGARDWWESDDPAVWKQNQARMHHAATVVDGQHHRLARDPAHRGRRSVSSDPMTAFLLGLLGVLLGILLLAVVGTLTALSNQIAALRAALVAHTATQFNTNQQLHALANVLKPPLLMEMRGPDPRPDLERTPAVGGRH